MTSKKMLLIIFLLGILGAIGFFVYVKTQDKIAIEIPSSIKEVIPTIPKILPKEISYHTFTLITTKPQAELIGVVGKDNIDSVLTLNRVDQRNLKKGSTLTIPDDFNSYLFDVFPKNIPSAMSIPKIVFVSNQMQAFGLYEYGVLVRQGPVSTGKKSTPTKSDLYFTNWKGKEVISSFSEEWILKWSFNIDNFGGISLHQYELPGYPASHSCVRLLEEDAKFLYDWALQWIVTPDGNSVLAKGTPVIIFGRYEYSKTAPWKNLPTNSEALRISDDEIEKVFQSYISKIEQAQLDREKTEASE